MNRHLWPILLCALMQAFEAAPAEAAKGPPNVLEGRLEAMMAKLADWQKDLGDPLPLTSDNPMPAEFTPPK
jgi:hypothetical protein